MGRWCSGWQSSQLRSGVHAARGRWHALLLVCCMWTGAAVHAEDAPFTGPWRFTQAQVAPWAEAANTRIQHDWRGQVLRVSPLRAGGGRHLSGPHPLRCDRVTVAETRVPAEGLFQGGLPAPAQDAARALGLPDGEVKGVSLTCSTGVFEFHRADASSLLLAVDNVIWTLVRSAGTQANDDAPEALVQRLLEAHFAGEMAFTPASAAAKRGWLTDGLWRAIEHWQAQPQSDDEAPVIDGDVFTDSQEYPLRFSVGPARAPGGALAVGGSVEPGAADVRAPAAIKPEVGAEAEVEVAFSFVGLVRPVTYVLRREADGWRVVDLRYADGGTLSALLR